MPILPRPIYPSSIDDGGRRDAVLLYPSVLALHQEDEEERRRVNNQHDGAAVPGADPEVVRGC